MTTTSSRFFDELAKLATNAAGAAQGIRREVDTLVKAQVERVLGDLAVVQREEFDAVRDMLAKAREENDALARRVSELEAQVLGSEVHRSLLTALQAHHPWPHPPRASCSVR